MTSFNIRSTFKGNSYSFLWSHMNYRKRKVYRLKDNAHSMYIQKLSVQHQVMTFISKLIKLPNGLDIALFRHTTSTVVTFSFILLFHISAFRNSIHSRYVSIESFFTQIFNPTVTAIPYFLPLSLRQTNTFSRNLVNRAVSLVLLPLLAHAAVKTRKLEPPERLQFTIVSIIAIIT